MTSRYDVIYCLRLTVTHPTFACNTLFQYVFAVVSCISALPYVATFVGPISERHLSAFLGTDSRALLSWCLKTAVILIPFFPSGIYAVQLLLPCTLALCSLVIFHLLDMVSRSCQHVLSLHASGSWIDASRSSCQGLGSYQFSSLKNS